MVMKFHVDELNEEWEVSCFSKICKIFSLSAAIPLKFLGYLDCNHFC